MEIALTQESMFELAIELRDNGALEDSRNVLLEILKKKPLHQNGFVVLMVLGDVYQKLGHPETANMSFRNAVELNADSELASSLLYLSYLQMDQDDEAIREMIRYLANNPAGVYKGTLEELLEMFEDGEMTEYKGGD